MRISKVYSHFIQKARQPIISRKQLPVLLVRAGTGIIFLALGADLVGIGDGTGLGYTQIRLAWLGLVILSSGAILDLTIGQRYIIKWPAQIIQDKLGLAKFLSISVQLGLLVLVIRQFHIENRAFYDKIVPLAMFGFVIHHFLPLRYRLPFFLLLSLTGIWVVFGFPNAAWLIAIGSVLAGICHLPIRFVARVVILITAGACLAILRSGLLPTPWSAAIWPILGSMFMFRLIAYLYDLRHSNEKVNVSRTLAYFFLLPNVVFPLFPVVDYNAFCRTYYDQDPYCIYQRGVRWMLLGLIHLILYRFVYQSLVISPSDVTTVSDLSRYLVTNFLLYFRVSGQFHMIVGMLHLFGFRLPKTNHFFFLASSFTDLWRRINIHWKDFMMKVFYYPTFFRMRKWGDTTGLVLSTLVVVFFTWILHSYQWFWILGAALLSWTDVLFWAILGLCLIANSLYETKHGRKRTLGTCSWSLRESAWFSLRTMGFFTVFCILWSLWTSPTLTDWFSLWAGVGVTVEDILTIITVLSVAVLVIIVAYRAAVWGVRAASPTPEWPTFSRSVVVTCFVILLLYAIGTPATSSRFGPTIRAVIRDLCMPGLNRQDAALLQRGYYENLTGVNRFNNQLWEVYAQRPRIEADWGQDVYQPTGDFLATELRPLAGVMFKGKPFRTNRWGMRDRDYEQLPAPDTYRIALLGASYAMGSGVGDGETFECLMEERLNWENRAGPYSKFEILNFAQGGFTPTRQLMTLQRKVLSFKPDAVFLISHYLDAETSTEHLAWTIRNRVDVPYKFLLDVAQEAGIDSATSPAAAERQLKPHQDDILSWAYRQIVAECREEGVLPVWIYVPMPGDDPPKGRVATLAALAQGAGFIVLDLSDVYDNHEIEALQVDAWDRHPNARGHQVIAERLYQALWERGEMIPLGPSTRTEGP